MSIEVTGKFNQEFFDKYYGDFFVSKHNDTHKLTIQEFYKLNRLNEMYYDIKSFLMNDKDIVARIGSAFRTEKINELIGGSKTSQHLFFEAIDLHFYKNGERIRGHEETKKIADMIDNLFGDMIQQMFWYDWGIHIGLATARTNITRRRGAR